MNRICELAPSGKSCAWGDGTRTTVYCIHRLKSAFQDMLKNLPIVGEDFDPFECPMFEEDKSGDFK